MAQTKLRRTRSDRNVGRAHPNSHSTLARAEAALNRREAKPAEKLARQILRQDRGHVAALEVLARALWQQNRFQEVSDVANRLVLLDPYNPGYRTLQGAALQCLGRYGEAVRAYASAGEADEARVLIAELREWQGTLVANLLKDDPSFQVEFARDPKSACHARGFDFLEGETAPATVTGTLEVAWAAVRPS